MNTPKPDSAVEVLKEARAIREVWSDGDASTMLSDGFVLVAVTAVKDDPDEHHFRYALIWPRPIEEADSRVRVLYSL